MFRALAVIAAFALLVYALSDFATSDERDRGGIPGWLWVVIIVVLPYFGPLAWIAFSQSRRRHSGLPGAPSVGGAPKSRRRSSGPIAPDDDPEFLWRLAREQQRQAGPTPPSSATAPGTTPETRPEGQAPQAKGTSGQGSAERDSSEQPPSRDQSPRSESHEDSDTTEP